MAVEIDPAYYKDSKGEDLFAYLEREHEMGISFAMMSALKYLTREGKKNGEPASTARAKAVQCVQRATDINLQMYDGDGTFHGDSLLRGIGILLKDHRNFMQEHFPTLVGWWEENHE